MTAMWRVGRSGAALLACVLVAGFACPAASATPEGQTTQTYGQPPVWGGCERFVGNTSAIPTAQCGTVSVPVDYANPEGAQAQLAVIRIPATGDRIGMLMVNPGGPGASAVDTVAGMGAALADTDIRRRFDLVGFDPRGVGHSTPELRCRTDAEFDAYRREPNADYSQAGVAHIEALYRQYRAELRGTGGQAVPGQRRHRIRGQGYGCRASGAGREPDQLSRLLVRHRNRCGVRGGLPRPDPGHGSRRRDRPELWTRSTRTCDQMAGFQTAFEDYATDCAQSAGCPLGTDPAQFVNRYHQLIDPLVTRPAKTSDPRGLSYQDAITGTVNALYSRQYWKFLTSGLLGLQRGTDPGDLLLLADDYLNRDPSGHYQNSQDAFYAIRCVNAPFPTDPAVWAAADQRSRRARTLPQLRVLHGFCST